MTSMKGELMPQPRQTVHVRLPASLHKLVVRTAEAEDCSLNTFLVSVISRGTAEFALANGTTKKPQHEGLASPARPSP
jgi:hypothetical protein